MPTSDDELQKQRDHVLELRQQLADEKAQTDREAKERENDIVAAQLDAEADQLQAEIDQAVAERETAATAAQALLDERTEREAAAAQNSVNPTTGLVEIKGEGPGFQAVYDARQAELAEADLSEGMELKEGQLPTDPPNQAGNVDTPSVGSDPDHTSEGVESLPGFDADDTEGR